MTTRHLLRSVPVLVLVAVLALSGAGTAQATPAPAADQPTTTTTTTAAGEEIPGIIPEPNSGHQPTEAGDRGGALQLGLLAVVVLAVGGITVLVVRESRRARARQPSRN